MKILFYYFTPKPLIKYTINTIYNIVYLINAKTLNYFLKLQATSSI